MPTLTSIAGPQPDPKPFARRSFPEPLTTQACLAEATADMAAKEVAEQAMSAEGGALSKATKVEAAVQIWPASPVTVPHRPAGLRLGFDSKAAPAGATAP